jgi:hypothetical protein
MMTLVEIGQNVINLWIYVTISDTLLICWGIQMWVPNKKQRKSKELGTFPGSQHFEGVKGRAKAPGWD